MINTKCVLNTPSFFNVPSSSVGGIATPGTLVITVLAQGSAYTVAAEVTSITSSVHTLELSLTELGNSTLVFNGEILAHVQVVEEFVEESSAKLLDEAFGSWRHDKKTGVLTLYSRQGIELDSYNVVDTTDETSRERV